MLVTVDVISRQGLHLLIAVDAMIGYSMIDISAPFHCCQDTLLSDPATRHLGWRTHDYYRGAV